MRGVVDPLEPRRRGRGGFGTLTAGMVLRGAVPAQVLYAGKPAMLTADEASQSQQSFIEPELPLPTSAVAAPTVQTAVTVAPAAPAAVPTEMPARAPGGAKDRRAMTVRLDPAQHMRLRVVSSYCKRSSQKIIVAALDAYFAALPAGVPGNCTCMVGLQKATK